MPHWVVISIIVVASLVLYMGICFSTAAIGPWRSLAIRFPYNESISGIHYRFVSMGAGVSSYSWCLSAIASSDHLTLWVFWPFRPFHPPMTLPRSEIAEIVAGRVLFMPYVAFCIAGERLKIYGPLAASSFWEAA